MEKTDSLSNYQLVTLAVALLGGDAEHQDREDIAIKAHELVPAKFSWRKYSNRIDLEAVGVALRDAKKEKNGELLIGSNARGWMLSSKGLLWIASLQIDKQIDSQLRERISITTQNQQGERERLYHTSAYELFVAGKGVDITQRDFFQFARVNEYFKDKARERRYTIVDHAVTGDETLLALWTYLKAQFS